MLPANTGPADTPMPKSTGSLRSSTPSVRAVDSAAAAGSVVRSGAPNTASAASPWNLLIRPSCSIDLVDDDPKELVEHRSDLMRFVGCRKLGRADKVDEEDRDIAFVARQRVARQRLVVVDRTTHHFLTDVTAEQIPQLFTFAKSGDHAIESAFEAARFRTVHIRRSCGRCDPVRLPPLRRRPHALDPKSSGTPTSSRGIPGRRRRAQGPARAARLARCLR